MLRNRPFVTYLWATLAALGCGAEGKPNPSGAAGQAGMSGSAGSGAGAAAGSGGAGMAGSSAGMAGADGGSAGSGAGTAGSAGSGGAAMSGCMMFKTDAEQPMLLSETGCIDMLAPTQPAPGLVPYSVRSALWSDGASKDRFLRVPDGMKIHVLDCAVEADACEPPGMGGTGEDDGHFQFPIGTVLVKSFSIEDQLIETRLLMRRTSMAWKGFSYEWNDDQTEATLLEDAEYPMGKDKPVGSGTQVWHYPGRAQCLECHIRYAGRSLGPSTSQMNSDFAYADGTMNQLAKLEQLGLFDAPPKELPGLPDPFGPDPLEQRARSYIQTNCAICHRPGGEFSTVDMRFATPLADTALCGVIERDMGTGVPLYRLVPGNPTLSAMSYRMHILDERRMPKIGSSVVDVAGSQLVDDWITSLPTNACPPQPQQ